MLNPLIDLPRQSLTLLKLLWVLSKELCVILIYQTYMMTRHIGNFNNTDRAANITKPKQSITFSWISFYSGKNRLHSFLSWLWLRNAARFLHCGLMFFSHGRAVSDTTCWCWSLSYLVDRVNFWYETLSLVWSMLGTGKCSQMFHSSQWIRVVIAQDFLTQWQCLRKEIMGFL